MKYMYIYHISSKITKEYRSKIMKPILQSYFVSRTETFVMSKINNNFVGELDGISETQLNFVLNELSKYGDRNPVVFEDVGKKGDNFLATVKRIAKDISDDGKKLKIIAKFAPTVAAVREIIQTAVAFKNESVVYNIVFTKFQELQDRFKVPEEYAFKFPKCFGTLDDAPNEVVLLEDLRERGYVVLNKFDTLSNNTIKVILKAFAVYNALSYAYRKYDSESFENVKKTLKTMFDGEKRSKDVNKPDAIIFAENLINRLVDTGERKDHMKGILAATEEYGRKIYYEDYDVPRSVIQHGDAWTNNLLFKLQNEQPESCILIDFQAAKIGSTALDLLFMLLSCSDHKSRVENFHDWMDYYYSELGRCLSHFGLTLQAELPREDFENDFKRYGKIALSVAMIITFFTNRESSEVVDIKTENVSIDEAMKPIDTGMSEATLNKLKIKYQGMYDTCVHFNLLD